MAKEFQSFVSEEDCPYFLNKAKVMHQEEFDEMSYQMLLASTVLAFGDARNEDVFLLHCLQNKK